MNKARKKTISNSECEIINFTFEQTENFHKSLELRIEVFVQEQDVPMNLELDGDDPFSQHFLLTHNAEAIGTFRYRSTDEGIKLERFAIKKKYRGLGFGNVLINAALLKLKDSTDKIYCYAQTSVIPFYKKHSFVEIGDAFMEAGIQHIKMIYKPL